MISPFLMVQFCSVQSLSHVWLFATPWIAAHQASLSITNSRSSPRLMFIELVMPSSQLILLLLPPIPPSIRVFSNDSTLRMRWPEYWSFSFSISPSKEHPGLISFRMDWVDLLLMVTVSEFPSSPDHFVPCTVYSFSGTYTSRIMLFFWCTDTFSLLSGPFHSLVPCQRLHLFYYYS